MQPPDTGSAGGPSAAGQAELARQSLIDTFLNRRSRRFALGNNLHGSALAFQSGAKLSR